MNIGFNKYFTNYIIKDLYTDTHYKFKMYIVK